MRLTNLFFLLATAVCAQKRPPEIPSRFTAVAPDFNSLGRRKLHLTVTSRRAEDPDSPADLKHLRDEAFQTLSKRSFMLVNDPIAAEVILELIVEPHLRYGMFHYQNAPYLFLTLRRAGTGQLLYCAYRRAGGFSSASGHLLRDLANPVIETGSRSEQSLNACAQQALRPRLDED